MSFSRPPAQAWKREGCEVRQDKRFQTRCSLSIPLWFHNNTVGGVAVEKCVEKLEEVGERQYSVPGITRRQRRTPAVDGSPLCEVMRWVRNNASGNSCHSQHIALKADVASRDKYRVPRTPCTSTQVERDLGERYLGARWQVHVETSRAPSSVLLGQPMATVHVRNPSAYSRATVLQACFFQSGSRSLGPPQSPEGKSRRKGFRQ